jgi:hypothetical protein
MILFFIFLLLIHSLAPFSNHNKQPKTRAVVDLIIELNDVKPKYERTRKRIMLNTFLVMFQKNKIDNINHDVGVRKFIDGKEKNEAFWVLEIKKLE